MILSVLMWMIRLLRRGTIRLLRTKKPKLIHLPPNQLLRRTTPTILSVLMRMIRLPRKGTIRLPRTKKRMPKLVQLPLMNQPPPRTTPTIRLAVKTHLLKTGRTCLRAFGKSCPYQSQPDAHVLKLHTNGSPTRKRGAQGQSFHRFT